MLEKCEDCGNVLENFRDEHSEGMICRNCGWSVVTTYTKPIISDTTDYSIYLIDADVKNTNQIRLVSIITNKNYIEARNLLKQDRPLIFKGKATEIKEIKDLLSKSELKYEILPQYIY